MDYFAPTTNPSDAATATGQMEIYGFSHEIVCPRDTASGLPTGKRQHKPFSF